jgi:PAS domain S-box-containing protein
MFRGVSAAALARAQAEHAQHQLALSLTSLHEREALLRTVIDEIPDVLVLKDKHGNFLLANETVARLYNTTPALMVGKDDADFGVPKDMSDFFRENVQSIMQRGETEVVFEDSTDTKTGEVRHFKSIFSRRYPVHPFGHYGLCCCTTPTGRHEDRTSVYRSGPGWRH